MSLTGKSASSVDRKTKKPLVNLSVPSPGLSKSIDEGNLSSDLSIVDSKFKGAKDGEAVNCSDLRNQSTIIGPSVGLPISGCSLKKDNSPVSTGVRSRAHVSSGFRGNGSVPSSVKGKGVLSGPVGEVLSFKDVGFGPREGVVRFRLIHFWEARNTLMKVLIGLEMLLIDEEGTVIQGFIPPGRIKTYLSHLEAGATYKLNNFFGSKNKTLYRVADPKVTISFTWNSVLSPLEDELVRFPDDRFRFHGYEEFEAASDLREDLYDFIGHIKLVNGEVFNERVVLDEADIASTRRVLLHVQTHDGPVMKLYLWDQTASDFCIKFKASGSTASVILVTASNPKRLGGALSLCTMAPSRVFLDGDVEATREYLIWLKSNQSVANRGDAEVVTKTETVSIGDLLAYMKQPDAKVAWFECTATVDDVVQGSGWYYVGCGVCHTKATKGSTTLMCKKCGKAEIVGVAQYLARISVYDSNDQAIFVLLGTAGEELTGKKAQVLVESYFEANDLVGDESILPVPEALSAVVGQTRRFIVKVSDHNLSGKTQTLTVTKFLPLEASKPVLSSEDDTAQVGTEDLVKVAEAGPSAGVKATACDSVKRAGEVDQPGDPKRPKLGF